MPIGGALTFVFMSQVRSTDADHWPTVRKTLQGSAECVKRSMKSICAFFGMGERDRAGVGLLELRTILENNRVVLVEITCMSSERNRFGSGRLVVTDCGAKGTSHVRDDILRMDLGVVFDHVTHMIRHQRRRHVARSELIHTITRMLELRGLDVNTATSADFGRVQEEVATLFVVPSTLILDAFLVGQEGVRFERSGGGVDGEALLRGLLAGKLVAFLERRGTFGGHHEVDYWVASRRRDSYSNYCRPI